jgi:hypothetical protein
MSYRGREHRLGSGAHDLIHRSRIRSAAGYRSDISVLLSLLSGSGDIAARINAEDLACTEYLLPQGVPDPPRNPDPPP